MDSDSASSAMTFSSILSKAVSALLVLRPWIISVICLLADADLARAFSVSFFDLASASFCSSILVTPGSCVRNRIRSCCYASSTTIYPCQRGGW